MATVIGSTTPSLTTIDLPSADAPVTTRPMPAFATGPSSFLFRR